MFDDYLGTLIKNESYNACNAYHRYQRFHPGFTSRVTEEALQTLAFSFIATLLTFHAIHIFCLGASLNLSVDNGKKSVINFDAEFKRLSMKRKTMEHPWQDPDGLRDKEYNDSDIESTFESDDGLYEMPDADDLVDFLINNSKFDPIVSIRRNKQMTEDLKQELKKLIEQKTLDREQLKSFIASLVEPVHLTQGPPGTGKSYLGVVIVQALMKIRNTWMTVCPSVGEPPILVLSYKNHAIDEFLVDLVKSEGSVSLVRIGGSCNDPNLNVYLEQNQNSYKYKTEKSRSLLKKLHEQKIEHQEMKNKLSPLSGWDALRESVPVDKEGADVVKQVSSQATVYLCSLIVRMRELNAYFSPSADQNEKEEFTDLWERLFSQDYRDMIRTIDKIDVEALCNDVEHYEIPVPEVLFRWLSGFRPLAKCSLLGCHQTVIIQGYKYCNDHLCAYGSDNIKARCYQPAIQGHYLCDQHACQAQECRAVRLPSPQRYCDEHACFVCVKEGRVAELGEDEPPRNTCSDHKLCTALSNEGFPCIELSVEDTPFCKQHAKPACSFVFPDGQQCSKYAASRGISYCDDHKPKPKAVTEFKQVTSRMCKAVNKKKKPCKGKAMEGFEYCKDHALIFKATPVNDQMESEKAWDTTSVEDNIPGPVIETNLHQRKSLEEKQHEVTDFLNEKVEDLVTNNDEKSTIQNKDADDFDTTEYEEPLPDEADFKPDDEEDYYFEEDDQLQHCRDVHVIEDREVEEKSDEEDDPTGDELIESDIRSDVEISASRWTWEMSLEERWTQAKLQEQKYKSLLAKLNNKRNTEIEIAREEYHKAKVRAKSEVYEKKAVIGGTIVGCIGRLESIRKTKPFAILVEEASEVLEPLLFACLGEATMKFEMIGDHLQLKPSIMSKIMFERVNR